MKSERQRLILELISRKSVETQEQLADELRALDIPVTQATVSRDIKELRLVKVPSGNGQYRYALPQDRLVGDLMKRTKRMFRDSVINIDSSESLIVIKTLPGTAQGIAFALDNLELPEVIGSIAGDDVILLVVKPITAVEDVVGKLNKLRA